jgi:hypothetical protein
MQHGMSHGANLLGKFTSGLPRRRFAYGAFLGAYDFSSFFLHGRTLLHSSTIYQTSEPKFIAGQQSSHDGEYPILDRNRLTVLIELPSCRVEPDSHRNHSSPLLLIIMILPFACVLSVACEYSSFLIPHRVVLQACLPSSYIIPSLSVPVYIQRGFQIGCSLVTCHSSYLGLFRLHFGLPRQLWGCTGGRLLH